MASTVFKEHGNQEATSSGRIRIGQIGIGHNHAAEKMKTLRKLSDHYDVVGVVEPDPAWRKKRGQDSAYEGLPWLTEEELFNVPGLEAIAVETDVPDLTLTAKRCSCAGMHIHLDKPGDTSLPEFKAMLDEADRRRLLVQMGYMFRNNPAIKFCQKAVHDGWLGDVFEIEAAMSRPQKDAYRQWLMQFPAAGMYIFGSHLIDLVVAMLGRPENVLTCHRQSSPDRDDLYDNGLAILVYPRATATVRVTMIEVTGFKRRRLIVCGDKGTIEIQPLEPLQSLIPTEPVRLRLTLSQACGEFEAGEHDIEFPPMPGRYDEQLIEFTQMIRGEVDNRFPSAHELAVQDTLLKACDTSYADVKMETKP